MKRVPGAEAPVTASRTAKDSLLIENRSTGEVNCSAISWFSAMPTTPQLICAPPWPPLQPSEQVET